MENLAAIFLSSFAIAFSGALMPGPLLSATISESSTRGWKVGPMYILGHAVLEIMLIAGLFLGLAPLLTSNGAFIVIAFAGGSFMIWMAGGMLRSLPTLSLNTNRVSSTDASSAEASGNYRYKSLPLTGALMSLANPYWIVWWATIGLGYVLSSRSSGLLGVGVFFFGHILADLIWYAFVSFAIDKGRNILPDKVYKGLIAVCAIFLLAYAGYLLVGGIRILGNI